MPAICPPTIQSFPPRQRGAVLMVMLVIMVIGAITIFVFSLNSAALKNARDRTTADALAKAKDALIGYATSNPAYPGGLPCPDSNNGGIADAFAGNHCPSYVGRLPWKTLGLPDLRDGDGERLWYALSPSVRNHASAQPINSDTPGQFNITGSVTANNVMAIVFAPQAVLSSLNQARDTANENNAANYLEGNSATNGAAITANTSGTFTFTINASSTTFNDQTILITHDQLFTSVEMRIAREARNCLDSYALSSANKYPWAAPVADATFTSTPNTYFGRIPVSPSTSGGGPPSQLVNELLSLQSLLNNMQAALTAFNANPNATNTSNLAAAAQNVINATNNTQFVSNAVNNAVDNAGDRGRDLANGATSLATVNNAITNASAALAAALTAAGYTASDPSMQSAWPASCLFTAAYWNAWQNLVFYQVAVGYEPNNSASCTTNITCLTINGSGNTAGGNGTYHAAVLVARKAINGQIRTFGSTATYLEGSNVNPSSTTPPTFETYNPSDATFQNKNDLVLCLDGKNNCK